jgi:choline dehydrogenase-like flavoprotein
VKDASPQTEETVSDYVIVGGGSAGCVLAARLSEDPKVRVTLLEAGGPNDSWIVNTPAALVLMIGTTLNNWHFSTTPQPGLGGRRGYQPRGKGLGGSSAINAMVYTRGHRADFDDWAERGNAGWGYDDVLPYFLRAEDNADLSGRYHHRGGPLGVCYPPSESPIRDVFIEAARQTGFPITEDFNGERQEGLGPFQATQRGGERCSSARAYLEPIKGSRPNLRVELHAQATRIVFEGKRAVAVDYVQHGRKCRVQANAEVVLSAGVFQSPQLLMLSGVGAPQILAGQWIETVHASPAVGHHLHDHPDFVFAYASDAPYLLGFSLAETERMAEAFAEYRAHHTGMLTSGIAECGGFLKSRPDQPTPDLQLHFGGAVVDDHGRKLHWGNGYSCHVALLHPKSRGQVSLASPDPFEAPLIDPNFLGEPEDLESMLEGFKITRRLMDAPVFQALRTRDLFTEHVQTDDEIRAVLRERVDTVYHPVGTCRMGPDPADSVVDAQLRVHGTSSLRVVDASIMPRVVSSNTNATSIMIGEKAADMIRADARS